MLIRSLWWISYLGLQRFLYADSPLNLGFTSFNLCHYLLDIGHFVFSLPKHSGISPHFIWSFALNFLADVVQVITTILLTRFDELVKLTLRPVCKALDSNRIKLVIINDQEMQVTRWWVTSYKWSDPGALPRFKFCARLTFASCSHSWTPKTLPALCNAYIFPSLDWHWLHVFRAWHWLRVFPRWTLYTAKLFLRLTLGTLSYAWCWRHVFPRSAPVTCYSHVTLVIRLSGTLDNPYT